MVRQHTTCWFLVEEAASGQPGARDQFAENYEEVVKAYLCHRWRSSGYIQFVEDAVQELFLECFKNGGILEKADRDRPGGFRAYLYAVARNVALRFETKHAKQKERSAPSQFDPAEVVKDEATLSRIFDRSWLESILRQAADRQNELAELAGPAAMRRVEILQLRFREDMSLRDIAKHLKVEAKWLYKEAARAREDFRGALYEVLCFHNPQSPEQVEKECEELLSLLG